MSTQGGPGSTSVGTGTTQDTDAREKSIGDLVKALSEETSTLVKQELALARAELTEQGKRAGTGAGLLGAAGIAGLLTLGALTATVIALLDKAMDLWLAALIATVVWAAIAGVLALQGRNKIKEATPPAPQTVETVKEDVRWAKTRT
jgi:uncharacterized membrane protein YqjE